MPLPDINQIDEAADSAAKASKTLADAWKQILIATGLLSIVGTVGLAGLMLWEGREQVAADIYKILSANNENTAFIDEWSLVPPNQFPEFWDCSSSGCVPDEARREKVNERLERLMADAGAIRAVFSLYGQNYRRIGEQVTVLGERRLSRELWLVPLSQDGYDENILRHSRGQCNSLNIGELDEGSLLRVEAPLYNTAFLQNCPVDRQDIPYQVRGYVSLDFSSQPNAAQIEALLRSAAEDIEDVMGY